MRLAGAMLVKWGRKPELMKCEIPGTWCWSSPWLTNPLLLSIDLLVGSVLKLRVLDGAIVFVLVLSSARASQKALCVIKLSFLQ